MEEQLKKLIYKIKESLKQIDSDGVNHPLLDDIYDYCEEMDDIIYSQEDDGISISDYMD
jgi:hypothetical protein